MVIIVRLFSLIRILVRMVGHYTKMAALVIQCTTGKGNQCVCRSSVNGRDCENKVKLLLYMPVFRH